MFSRDLLFYHTSLGTGAVAATDAGVCQVWLPGDDLTGLNESNTHSTLLKTAADQLEQYFAGCLQQFTVTVDVSRMTAFQQRALQATIQIPYANQLTYGTLANQIGSPGAARAVGGALAANPVPLIIPCHRVLSATGRLTGFSAAGGVAMKEWLLRFEQEQLNKQL